MPDKNDPAIPFAVRQMLSDANAVARLQQQLKPYSFVDEVRKIADTIRPFSIAEQIKNLTPTLPASLADEIRKAFAIPSYDFTAELRKLSAIPRISSLATEMATLGQLHKQQDSIATELSKAAALQSTRLIDQIRAMTQSVAARPASVTDLLAVSFATYETLYGTYRPIVSPTRAAHRSESASEADDDIGSSATDFVGEEAINQIELVEAATESVAAAVSAGRVDVLSAEFYLNVLITLLILLLQLHLSDESEKRMVDRISATETTLIERLGELEAQQDSRELVYARRFIDLRNAPTSRAHIVGSWYPNIPGRVVAERRYWVCVEYFDRSQQRHLSGWCRKKYVLR